MTEEKKLLFMSLVEMPLAQREETLRAMNPEIGKDFALWRRARAGRRCAGERAQYRTVSIPEVLHRDLKQVAEERGCSIAHVLVLAAEEFLNNLH